MRTMHLSQQICFSGITARKINLALARADKPAFGASGLSARMLDMQLGEMRVIAF